MWDDHTRAWRICFPWWRTTRLKNGLKVRHFGQFITIWHVDPHGDRRYPCGDRTDTRRLWRFHVHHWKLQIHPWQNFKRWAFERCAECGGRYSWGYAPVRHGKGAVHQHCSRSIWTRDRLAQVEEIARHAINGYCRTMEMETREAIDVLIPGRTGQLPEWRTHYAARSLMGVLEDPASTGATDE